MRAALCILPQLRRNRRSCAKPMDSANNACYNAGTFHKAGRYTHEDI